MRGTSPHATRHGVSGVLPEPPVTRVGRSRRTPENRADWRPRVYPARAGHRANLSKPHAGRGFQVVRRCQTPRGELPANCAARFPDRADVAPPRSRAGWRPRVYPARARHRVNLSKPHATRGFRAAARCQAPREQLPANCAARVPITLDARQRVARWDALRGQSTANRRAVRWSTCS